MLDPLSASATRTATIALVLAFLFIYLIPLGVRPLKRPDEVRYAAVPQEMLRDGDMVVPHLNGMRYFEKPAPSYWMTAASMRLFGKNEFAVRLPVALASGVTMAAVAWLAASTAGALAALLAVSVLMTSLGFYAVGTHLVLDMPFTAALTLALACFFVGDRARTRRARHGLFASCGAFCAAATLIKGPLGLLLPGMILFGYLLWERRIKNIVFVARVPLLAFAITVLPWTLLVHVRDGGFWHYFIMVEHVHRFLADEAQHIEPFWFFAPVFLGTALPWTIALPTTLIGVRRAWRVDDHLRNVIRYAICWFVLPFLFFSISKGKLATYVLPLFPAFALLVGIGLPRALAGRPGLWFRWLSWAGVVLAAALGIAVLVMIGVETDGEPVFETRELWKAIAGAIALFTWAGTFVAAARASSLKRALRWFAVAPWLALAAAPWLLPDLVNRATAPESFLMAHADRIDGDTVIVADATVIHAVLWHYDRDDVYVIGGSGEFTYGLSFPEQAHRHIEGDDFAHILESDLAGQHVVVIARTRHINLWYDNFAAPDFEVREGRYAWVEYGGRGRGRR